MTRKYQQTGISPWRRTTFLAIAMVATACAPPSGNNDESVYAGSRVRFPVVALERLPEGSESDVILPARWDIRDITLQAFNDDLVIVYHGEAGAWPKADQNDPRRTQALAAIALATHPAGKDIGLAVDQPVAVLVNWYRGTFGTHFTRIVGKKNGRPAFINLQPAVDMGRLFQGTDGRDALQGSADDDTLIGGPGADLLLGGPGDDTYLITAHDGMDTILDESGDDTVEFAGGIALGDLALRREADSLVIEVRGKDANTYLLIGTVRDATESVEHFRFADGMELGIDELAGRVSNEALSLLAYVADLRLRTTVAVPDGPGTDNLQAAVLAAALANAPPALCVTPSTRLQPVERTIKPGLWEPATVAVVFRQGDTTSEDLGQALRQYEVLAAVGLMTDTELPPVDGQLAGVRFGLTWEGWGSVDRDLCFRYADRTVLKVSSYRPLGQKLGDLNLYAVQATLGVADVVSWARQPVVLDAFPEIVRQLAGVAAEVVLAKDKETWIPVWSGRAHPDALLAAPGMPPTAEEIRTALDARGEFPEWTRPLCAVLPMLLEARVDPPGAEYETAATVPFDQRGDYLRKLQEARDSLDVLTGFGVARRYNDVHTYPNGQAKPRLVYSVGSPYAVERNRVGFGCLLIADSEFEILDIRSQIPGRFAIKGRWTAKPWYDWVRTPEFRRIFPTLTPQITGGAAVRYSLVKAGDQWQWEF
ncbi:MAG: hypothetical protein R3F24_14560 [Gammaproteobacteria bacterium]